MWLPTSTSQPPPADQLAKPAPPATDADSATLNLPASAGRLASVAGAGNNRPNDGQSASRKVLIVLDEGDGSGFYPRAKSIPYTVYFKRSWVNKRDGHFTGVPRRLPHAYFPMVYVCGDLILSCFRAPGGKTAVLRCQGLKSSLSHVDRLDFRLEQHWGLLVCCIMSGVGKRT